MGIFLAESGDSEKRVRALADEVGLGVVLQETVRAWAKLDPELLKVQLEAHLSWLDQEGAEQ